MDYNVLQVKQRQALQTHVFCLALVGVCVDACLQAPAPDCGCVFQNHNPIPEEDYICEPIHSQDAENFRSRMKNALERHWAAYTFIYTFPEKYAYPEESGEPICKTDRKRILGYWKDYGVTLCLVVRPDKQVLTKAVCDGEACCTCNKSMCEPGGFELTSYLVYCDVIYTKTYGVDTGSFVGTDVFLENHSQHVPEHDFIDRSKRDVPAQHVDETERYRAERHNRDVPEERYFGDTDYYRAGRQKRREPPPGDGGSNGYFEFRHDYFPSSCSCTNCNHCMT